MFLLNNKRGRRHRRAPARDAPRLAGRTASQPAGRPTDRPIVRRLRSTESVPVRCRRRGVRVPSTFPYIRQRVCVCVCSYTRVRVYTCHPDDRGSAPCRSRHRLPSRAHVVQSLQLTGTYRSIVSTLLFSSRLYVFYDIIVMLVTSRLDRTQQLPRVRLYDSFWYVVFISITHHDVPSTFFSFFSFFFPRARYLVLEIIFKKKKHRFKEQFFFFYLKCTRI